ncbi:pilus assembly protein [Stenotrophomonas sp. SRS1]|uniref:pilus assembly PilX family protein n=1 Tax=Stenotrophomonas sp. SRS1 TaxID=2870345 RepID=UPI002238D3EE|nr:PilX N-terminal domain-containing pilus assembly protein [Stenotrophomonas sp. SRS1]MCW6029880.1 pilus assembly protein [Stenotrophomonas sp. SRS1]
MHASVRPVVQSPVPRHQRGAVLYVALVMLILLALIGIAGMQVAGMQEKMSANYRASNLSFQNTEATVRTAEHLVEKIANREALPDGSLIGSGDIDPACDAAFDPSQWGSEQSSDAVPAVTVRQIDTCVPFGTTVGMGGPRDNPIPIYQITGYAADDADNPTSSTVIDTVFKL